MRWLINKMKVAYKREWQLEQHVTIDETMVKYKGKYCFAWQYMPRKPIKWGLKVWVMVDATSHIISNFEFYCKKSIANLAGGMSQRAEQNLMHQVVTDLTAGLDNKSHIITMDNFFTSVGSFHDLEHRGIYAIGTMHSNCIGLHLNMRKIKEFRKRGQGNLQWFIHNSRKMCSVLWKSKCMSYYFLLMHHQLHRETHGIARFLGRMVQEGPTFLHPLCFRNTPGT